MKNSKVTSIGGQIPTNGAKGVIDSLCCYNIFVTIKGISDILFHRWNCEAVEEKSKASKNSAIKKVDDLEAYIYRDETGFLAIPGEYLRQSMIQAAKFKSDPRSSRKSAMDLYKAGIICLTNLSSLGVKNWDYEDKRRAVVQRSGINRIRPALKEGWSASFDFQVNLPEYISEKDFCEVLNNAGRLIGIGDFRPTYGRFQVIEFKKIQLS